DPARRRLDADSQPGAPSVGCLRLRSGLRCTSLRGNGCRSTAPGILELPNRARTGWRRERHSQLGAARHFLPGPNRRLSFRSPAASGGASAKRPLPRGSLDDELERETGVEPATSTLARWRSTTELFPLNMADAKDSRRGREGQGGPSRDEEPRRSPLPYSFGTGISSQLPAQCAHTRTEAPPKFLSSAHSSPSGPRVEAPGAVARPASALGP